MSGGGLDLAGLAARALASLNEHELAQVVVYLDGELRLPGARVAVGDQEIEISTPTAVAFVDEKPGANWMHPCRYLLVEPERDAVRAFAAIRPPSFGRLPASWRVISKPPTIEHWRLLPLSDQPGGGT